MRDVWSAYFFSPNKVKNVCAGSSVLQQVRTQVVYNQLHSRTYNKCLSGWSWRASATRLSGVTGITLHQSKHGLRRSCRNKQACTKLTLGPFFPGKPGTPGGPREPCVFQWNEKETMKLNMYQKKWICIFQSGWIKPVNVFNSNQEAGN